MIRIAEPIIGAEEIAAVNQVLESGHLAQGPKVDELEQRFAKYCGTKYAVAVNSGTAALHSALFAAGITAGDEVITTPFTFIATFNSILMLGAKPVLVDIKADDFNLNPELISGAITRRTKAILAVDLFGQPYDYAAITAISKKYNLKIIEDACQALGASYKDKKAGSLGDLGCFSLYATKNIMSGEGGVITTNNATHVTALRQFRQHGMSSSYEYQYLGYNYRMTDLHAAIAIAQLKKVDTFTRQRNRNARILTKGLRSIPGLVIPCVDPNKKSAFHQYTIRITKDFPVSRDKLLELLHAKEIGAAIYYPKPLFAYPHLAKFKYEASHFPEAVKAAREVVSLPVHPKVSASQIKYIVRTIQDIASVK